LQCRQKGRPRPNRKESYLIARWGRDSTGCALTQDREAAYAPETEAKLSRPPALSTRRSPASAGKGSGRGGGRPSPCAGRSAARRDIASGAAATPAAPRSSEGRSAAAAGRCSAAGRGGGRTSLGAPIRERGCDSHHTRLP